MPAVSERQRSAMGADLSRKRSGKKTRTGMTESQLKDFASNSVGDVMGKSLIKAITKYLRKQEDDYPPTKGERREGKRLKARRMGVSGAGVKDTQQIIGRKAKGLDKQNVSEATATDPEASKRSLNRQRVASTQSKPMPDPSTSSPTVVPGQERHSRPLPLAEEASHSPMGTRQRGYVAASENSVAKAIDTYLKAEEYPPVDPKVIREGMKKIREARQGRKAKSNGYQPTSPTPSA